MSEEIVELIEKYDVITIYRHEFADPDALGSQFALKELILDNFKNKEVYVLGNNVKTLNGVLFPKMDECENKVIENSLCIVLDTANEQRIDDKRYKTGKEIMKIDHHPIIEQYGTYNFVDESVCATCFYITRLALECDWKISDISATYLYAGIVGDTGRFLHNNTTADVLAMAEKLVLNGADISRVYNAMYSRSINETKLTGYILESFKIYNDKIAYYILEANKYQEIGVEFEKAKEYVNTLAGIEGIDIWVSATFNPETNFYHVSLRSRSVEVNGVAQEFGGGGHKFASGIKVSTLERFDRVLCELSKKI